jgi:hypothetical protein
MAKRFISTEMFDDEWFSELSKDGKLFFIYFITKCDHAGILRLNRKLFEFQTKIKGIETVIQELGNSLVTVKDGVYFMPKFLKFQYPEFPKSNVKQQSGAITILSSLGLWDYENNTYLTLTKELSNSYDNDNVNDIVIISNWRKDFEVYKQELINEYNRLTSDKKYILEREKYHPGLDIKLSIQKACKDYWSKEAGWKNKKNGKTVDIDWEATFNNALSQKVNQVWKSKAEDKY